LWGRKWHSRRYEVSAAAWEAEMKVTKQSYKIRMASCNLAPLGIAVLLGIAVCASGAQEQQRPPIDSATMQATPKAATSSEKEAGQPVPQQRNPRYELGKGDVLDLNFPFTPEFNQTTVTVQPDGYITLTDLGDVYVAGKTVRELREALQTAYGKILHDPVINVVLKDFEKPYFIAGGQIGHPGKYDLRGDTTLSEAVAIAGGFTENSKHSQVLLFRRVSNEWAEARIVNVKRMFQAGNLTEDIYLKPGDMFFVPQNAISKIRKWIPYTSISGAFNPTGF
jgi:polysaccharide biosynthesis/export protein